MCKILALVAKKWFMTKQTLITFLILLIVATSGCGTATTLKNEQYVVTGHADGAPIGCSPQDITHRLAEMFDAINRGDPNLVDEYFGRKDGAPFAWYSMTEVGKTDAEVNNFAAHSWDSLAAYFEQRYQQHERMHLRSVQFNGWEPERGLVHFGPIEFTRYADDLRPGLGGPESIALGKGAYHCKAKAFVVLSLAMSTEQP